jgi:3-deoxy-D-manno-octulosonic-acid transferase
LLFACLSGLPPDWKLVIAPHEINEEHIRGLSALFGKEAVLFSSLPEHSSLLDKRVLIFDTMGLLSSLYAYGTLAFVGGGFKRRGLHNILEPAAYGNLVLFGPEYTNFMEAISLVEQQLAFPVNDEKEAAAVIQHWIQNPTLRKQKAAALQAFMREKTGATDRIIEALIRSQYLPSKVL